MFTAAFLCVILVVSLLITFRARRPKKFPPGPRGLPIIGNVHQLEVEVYKSFMELRKVYGDTFSINLGSYRAIVLHDPHDIKKAFNMNAFSGRIYGPHFVEPETGLPRGIIFTQGRVWSEQRRFALKNLRDFGFGKKSMEVLVREEINELIADFLKDANAGKPICTSLRFNVAVLNALWTIITGERHHHKDEKINLLLNHVNRNTTNSKALGSLLFFPWLSKYFPGMSGLNEYVGNIVNIFDMMKDYVKTHKETYQEGVNRDLIDCYLEEMYKTNDPKSSFYGKTGDANLIMTMYDFFLAGAETTSATLTWECLILSHFPEHQEKLFEEINRVVGIGRQPSLTDRPNMPYTEAIIHEVMRYAALAPLGVMHQATEDSEFNGYIIPKGTIVIPNQYSVLHDEKLWDHPETFCPERFLSEDGKSVIRHDAFIPFSIGKRVCPGESLARDQLFLFTTAIFQRFKIGFVPNQPVPPMEPFPGAPVRVLSPLELLLQDRFE